ncbi:tannase and feruloyl esterase-domain-containing protein [Bisporella sp. PMI_857]|nr:tannase and feruloyl esterase-domain-containing protein [Bisporella sp. PMI_857]
MILSTNLLFLSLACARLAFASLTSCSCSAAALSEALLGNSELLSVRFVPAGGSFGEGTANIPFPTNPTNLPANCAIIVNVTTSPVSSFRFGLFLPTTTWNERFLTVGNGGFSGGINWLDMGSGLQTREDFGFRAIHETAVITKEIIKRFYNAPPKFSYYSGCSMGGRQGLKDAQKFPEDFDGMLIGAPAWWLKRFSPWITKLGISNLPIDAPNRIPLQLLSTIGAEVTRQCDGVDGVVDGIVSAPDECNFDLSPLLCGYSSFSECFTNEQAQTAKEFYNDYMVKGKLMFPGLELSSEEQWALLFSGEEPNPLGSDYIKYFLLNDPDWRYQDYTDDIILLADRLDPGQNTADSYDMSDFRNQGSKIIMYHGMSDGVIPSRSSNIFYEKVAATMGGAGSLSNWFRFFLVPGLQHCVGTAVGAPWYVAGPNQAGVVGTDIFSVPGFSDPKHDVMLALMEWVEDGTAVDSLVATAWIEPLNTTSGVKRQRPICSFPARAVWDQTGDVNSANSWLCR